MILYGSYTSCTLEYNTKIIVMLADENILVVIIYHNIQEYSNGVTKW